MSTSGAHTKRSAAFEVARFRNKFMVVVLFGYVNSVNCSELMSVR